MSIILSSAITRILRLSEYWIEGKTWRAYVAISGNLPQLEAAMTDRDVTLPPTLPLQPFAQAAYGLSENSAYAAARRGDIPTIRVGGLLKVPVRVALAKMA